MNPPWSERLRYRSSRLAWELAGPLLRRAYAWTGRDVTALKGTDVRLRVDPSTSFGREMLRYGERRSEPFLIPLLGRVLRPGDAFADVGSHWGTYAVVASRLVGEKGKVLAVEPYGKSFERLKENARRNGCANLSAVRVAVGEAAAEGRLSVRGDGDNLNRLVLDDSGESCRVATLEALLAEQGIGDVQLMKMDIEGAECLAARDLVRYTHRFAAILIELHPPFTGFECDPALLYRMLADGRDLFVISGEDRRLAPVPSFERFNEALGEYYFVSVRKGEGDILAALRELTW